VAALVVQGVGRRDRRVLVWLLGSGTVVVLLALAWPYYPLFGLLQQSSIYASSHHGLYNGVLQRTFLAVVALPVVARRMQSNWRDPLGLMFVGGCTVYAWGWLSRDFTYGRIISFIMLVLQITLGAYFADLEQRMRESSYRPLLARVAYGGIGVLLLIGIVSVSPGLVRTIPRPLLPSSLRSDVRLARVSDTYGFLARCTGQYDVVLTDMSFGSLVVPTFGGKLVATGYPIPFVDDTATREADVERFFRPDATVADRRAILTQYGVSYLLVDRTELELFRTQEGFSDYLGDIVYEHGGVILLTIRNLPNTRAAGGAGREWKSPRWSDHWDRPRFA
jgi:hypothetical protein